MVRNKREDPVLVGEIVKRHREQAKLEPEDLAERANVPLDSLERVEAGNELPSWDWLIKVAQCLESNAEELLKTVDMLTNEEAAELLVKFLVAGTGVTEEYMEKILQFVRDFAHFKTPSH